MRIILNSHIQVPKQSLSKNTLQFIHKNLTFNNPEYRNAMGYSADKRKARYIPKYIKAYQETNEYVYMTRGFLKPLLSYLKKEKVKYKLDDQTASHKAGLGLLPMQLYPYQKRASKKAVEQSAGVIKMPCGAGKTITLTDVIRQLDQTTIIIVHTNFIKDQWLRYFKEKYNYEPGIIQGSTVKLKPITIAMIQSLYKLDELSDKFLNYWGCVVVDETHRVPANTFFSVVNNFPAKYRFGTTATARRNDGLTNMIFATLGEIIYNVRANTLAKRKYLTIPQVNLIPTKLMSYTNNYQTNIKGLCGNYKRNKLIADNVYKHRDRFNLVLSNRIEHLQNLVNIYGQRTDDYELVIGKMKQEQRNDIIKRMVNGELHTIFATQLADEGLDIPNLDTIHLAFPTKADAVIEQRIGRVQRYKDYTPLVFDYVDELIPKFYEFSQNRLHLYQELELNIETSQERQTTQTTRAEAIDR